MAKNRKMLTVVAGLVFCLAVTPSMNASAARGNKSLEELSGGIATILEPGSTDVKLISERIEMLKLNFEDEKVEEELVMSNIKSAMNIRSEANEKSQKVGKLYKDCGGIILERKDGWTKLQSGNLIGWAKDDLLLFGEEAEEFAHSVGKMTATVEAEVLFVREEPDAEAKILGLLPEGEIIDVLEAYEEVPVEEAETVNTNKTDKAGETAVAAKAEEKSKDTAKNTTKSSSLKSQPAKPVEEEAEVVATTEVVKDWIKVDYEGKDGYVSAEFVTLEFKVDTGETIEEINAKRNVAPKSPTTEGSRFVNYGEFTVDDDTKMLLAALIHCEAGGESYEGQVAVGAVVLNRVRSKAYPDTIHGVIYASGQFTPAMTGKLNRVLESGKTYESCIRAAEEALSGVSNVGDITHFRRNDGREGLVIGNHVFY